MNAQTNDHLAEQTREAFRALPAKHRTPIFKKAPPASPTLRALLKASHIPPSFQPARIANWLTADQQRKLEELVLLPEHESWFQSLLRNFFCNAHKPLNDLLLDLIDPNGPNAQTFEQAFASVQEKFPQDPYLALYVAATRWVCCDAMNTLNEHAADKSDFPELDKELTTVSDAVAGLYDINPAAVTDAVNALQRAQVLTSSLAGELKSLATEASEPEPDWSSREDFIAHRERLAAVVSSRTKMIERASILVETLASLLAGATVRHRLPSRSVALTELAHRASTEITQHAADLKNIVMSQPGSAHEWLQWLWHQEGTEAENLQQKLRPISPALADLLADAPWPDLQWPAPSAPPASPAEPKQIIPAQTAPAAVSVPVPAQQVHPKPDAPAQAAPAPTAPPAAQPKPEPPALLSPPTPIPSLPPPQVKPQEPPPPKAQVPAPTPAPAAKTPQPPPPPLAEPATAPPPTEERSPLAAAVWRLAVANRWGLASHLATLNTTPEMPPAWLFEAAALSPRINYEVSPISERLTETTLRSADFHIDSLRPEIRIISRVLLAAVAFRPALLAPKTGAASLLKLSELTSVATLQALGQLAEAVAEFGLHRQALQPDMLLSSHNVADWERQLAQVRAEIHQWLEQAPVRGFNYAIAARIWRKWTTHNGPLRQLLLETANAGPRQVEALRAQWQPWATRAAEFVQSGIREF